MGRRAGRLQRRDHGSNGILGRVFATGDVTGPTSGGSNYYLGGLVGYNEGKVDHAYAVGNVLGSTVAIAGGLIGANGGGGFTQVSNTYAAGTVAGLAGKTGGLIGESSATVSNSYWNTDSFATPGVGFGTFDGDPKDNVRTADRLR